MAKGLWVILNVADVAKSVEFYKGLGFRTQKESMGDIEFADVDLGGSMGFILFPKDETPDMPQPADTKEWLTGELGKGVMVSVGVANAERVWKKAKGMRATVDAPIGPNTWGGKGFTLVDPDGYVVNLTDKFPPPSKPARKAKGKAKARRKVPAKAKAKAKRRR